MAKEEKGPTGAEATWLKKIKDRFGEVIAEQHGQFAHIAMRVTIDGLSEYEELVYYAEGACPRPKAPVRNYLEQSDGFFQKYGTVMNEPNVFVEDARTDDELPEVSIPASLGRKQRLWYSPADLNTRPANHYSLFTGPNEDDGAPVHDDDRRRAYLWILERQLDRLAGLFPPESKALPTAVVPRLSEFAACVGNKRMADSISEKGFHGYGVAMYYVSGGRSVALESEILRALSTWLVQKLDEQAEREKEASAKLKKQMIEVAYKVGRQRSAIQAIDRMINGEFGDHYSKAIRGLASTASCKEWLPPCPDEWPDSFYRVRRTWSQTPEQLKPKQRERLNKAAESPISNLNVLRLLLILSKNKRNRGDLAKCINQLADKNRYLRFDLAIHEFTAVASGLYRLLRTPVFDDNEVRMGLTCDDQSQRRFLEIDIKRGRWSQEKLLKLQTRVKHKLNTWANGETTGSNTGNASEAICNLMGVDFCNAALKCDGISLAKAVAKEGARKRSGQNLDKIRIRLRLIQCADENASVSR